jgi:O-antigen ligase
VDFFLLILATGVLFIRPTDLIPELESVQVYLIMMLACLVTSAMAIAEQLSVDSLKRRPITACVLGLLVAFLLSDLGNFRIDALVSDGFDFSKIILYYLLVVGLVNSRSRLRCYVLSVAGILIVPIGLAVLQYFGYINLPAFMPVDASTGMRVLYEDGRLRGTGMYGDPNDVCLLINLGIMLSLYGLVSARGGLVKVLWLAPLALFVEALRATQSRGGFLAALVSIAVLLWARFGTRKGLLLATVALPVIFSQFGGRQAHFDLSDTHDTGQLRIQLWASAMDVFKSAPILGVGPSQAMASMEGRVAHNSFLQAYAHLGFIGGTLLVGAFYHAYRRLFQLQRRSGLVPDPELDSLRPYVLAALTGYVITMMTTTHPFDPGTYGVLGIAVATIRLGDADQPPAGEVLTGRMMVRLILVSLGFLLGINLYLKIFLHY